MKVLTNEELKDLDLTKILRVGDEVWDIRLGKGIVEKIDLDNYDYPLVISYPDFTFKVKYSRSGSDMYALYPSLYLYEIPIPEYKIPITFEKDELVWVKYHTHSEWQIRFYDVYTNGNHYVYNKQLKSTDSTVSVDVFDIRKFYDNPLL